MNTNILYYEELEKNAAFGSKALMALRKLLGSKTGLAAGGAGLGALGMGAHKNKQMDELEDEAMEVINELAHRNISKRQALFDAANYIQQMHPQLQGQS